MKIISHRGYWQNASQKNSVAAFRRSFALGFGTETDVRDFAGRLVISHDIPTGDELSFDRFLEIAGSYNPQSGLTLALNIKSDGLVDLVNEAIAGYAGLDCFVFDMSVPDSRAYLDSSISVFMRMSEVERTPSWGERADGIWLDCFEDIWFDETVVTALLDDGKSVCLVSPELHGREPDTLWQYLHPLEDRSGLILCTDFPELAQDYFYQTGGTK